MLTIVTYDISDNTSRSYYIKKLQSYGLYRIQKSVFAGHLTNDERLDLAEESESFLSSGNDAILYCGEVYIPEDDLNYRFL